MFDLKWSVQGSVENTELNSITEARSACSARAVVLRLSIVHAERNHRER